MRRSANAVASGGTALAVALLSLCTPLLVEAAGLGELQTSSALGQPFEARIDLSGSDDELESAQASIASEAAYDQAGIPRVAALDRLQVEVVRGVGAPYLRISSRQLIGEPMLQLMVDLRAAGRTVRREYSVLLDPPAAAGRAAAAPAPVPAAASAPPPAVKAEAPSTAPSVAATAAPIDKPARQNSSRRHGASTAAVAAPSGDRYGPVASGETLGSIAERLRERLGGSFQSRVDALRRANPDAFEPGRSGWVRLGALLVVPGPRAAVGTAVAGSAPVMPATAAAPAAPAVRRFRLAERLAEVPPALPASSAVAAPAQAVAPATTAAPAAPATAEATASRPAAVVPAPPLATRPPAPAPASPAEAVTRHWWSDFRLWIFLLLGLLAYFWWRRRQRWQVVEPLEEEPIDEAPVVSAPRTVVRTLASPVAANQDTPAEEAVAAAPAAPPAPEPAAEPEPVVAARAEPPPTPPPPAPPATAAVPPTAQSAVVDEASAPSEDNVHGFYGEVAQLLLGALTREPGRRDLRMKLLEVYYESREVDLFHKHARLYLQSLEGRDDEHWPRIQAMGREMLPAASLFTAQSRSALALAARPLRFYEHDLADTLEPALQALARDYRALHVDPEFCDGLLLMLAVIRPQGLPLAPLREQTEDVAQVWCKWERIDPVGDAAHVNAYSQAFLASGLHRQTLITATRSGRHGIAVAAAAAELGLGCSVYMHEGDYELNPDSVRQIRALRANVIVHPEGVFPGDARTAALREWLHDPQHSLYISSLAAGPHPYPAIVRDFQALLGAETKAQVIERFQRRPLAVVVSRDDGPSAISILQAFLDDRETALYCIDAERPMANPAYRREHSWLQHTGRVQYLSGREAEANALRVQLAAGDLGAPVQGSARAAAFAQRIAEQFSTPGEILVLMRRDSVDEDAAMLDLELDSPRPDVPAIPAAETILSLPEPHPPEPGPQEPGPAEPAPEPETKADGPQLKPTIGLVRSRR